MIVPQFWAEARSQHKANGKQITVRRLVARISGDNCVSVRCTRVDARAWNLFD